MRIKILTLPELLLEINGPAYVHVAVSTTVPGMWHSGNARGRNKQRGEVGGQGVRVQVGTEDGAWEEEPETLH